jgi:hypothetical protein
MTRMKKEVLQGIPFWLDLQNRVYAFEGKEVPAQPLWLGTYSQATQKIEFRPDWETAYKEKLETYRKNSVARARVPSQS